MDTSFWSSALFKDDVSSEKKEARIKELDSDSIQERISIHHKIPKEDVHELPLDVYQTDDKIFAVAPLAGVRSSDLDITIDQNTIYIIGKRSNPFQEYMDYIHSSECYWGSFERKLVLPSTADTRDVSASFRNGILIIETPRLAPSGLKKIKIN